MLRCILAIISGFGLTIIATPTVAQSQSESESAALSGRRAWDAMECAGYAAFAGYSDEQARLEQLGFQEGRVFLTAARAGKIAKPDFDSIVPMTFYGRMSGPSVEFVLGRIFQVAEEYVGERLWQKGQWAKGSAGSSPDDATIRARAQGLFDSENCKSLR